MSISTTTTTASFLGNGSTSTPYPLTGINYVSDQHIKVYADGVLISTDEAVSDYCTFTGDGTTGAGQFTTSLAYADTVAVEVFLTPALDQPVVLQETGSLPAKTLENQGFDRLNMQIRWLARKVANCFTLGSIEDSASTGTADNLIGFDGSGDIAEIPNTTFLQTANNLSDVDAATARTNLGVDAAGTDNSTDVTKTGAGTYVSLAGQVLTVDAITESDISDLGAYIENVTGSPLSELQDVTITTPSTSQVLAWNGSAWVNTTAGNGDALTTSGLDQFAATTSLQLKNTITDETGTGSLVFATSPALVTPDLGTPSAADLTNATNYPESNGTVQGTDFTYDIKAVASNDAVTPNARGEYSVDLQGYRTLATEVASGQGSVIVGGYDSTASGENSGVISGGNNEASGARSFVSGGLGNTASSNGSVVLGGETNTASTAKNTAVVGGENNTAIGVSSFVGGGSGNSATAQYAGVLGGATNAAQGANSFVMGGYGNTASGARGTIMMGANSTASGDDSMAVGTATTASHKGARMIGDGTFTAFASKATHEFGVQADNIRLDVGTPAVGDVLTCDNADGSSQWAAPAKVVYTVATLPATPAQGDVAIVTDALTPAFLSAVASGGAVVTPVFWNGTAWIVG